MRWMIVALILLLGSVARGDETWIPFVGKVVAVPDGDTLWVYLEEARASYCFTLVGVAAPPLSRPLGRTAQVALQQAILGRTVEVSVERLTEAGEIPAEVRLEGQSINRQIALLLDNQRESACNTAVCEDQPRRPVLQLCIALRSLLPCRDRSPCP